MLAEFDFVMEAPNWSHDGTFLTYNAEGKIYRFDLATKESTLIDTGDLCTCNNDHVPNQTVELRLMELGKEPETVVTLFGGREPSM